MKDIPLWPPRAQIKGKMPKRFKSKYSTTRVILVANEIYIDQPCLPELNQIAFSNYKNHNIFKGLTGVSSDGLIMFMAFLRIHVEQPMKIIKELLTGH